MGQRQRTAVHAAAQEARDALARTKPGGSVIGALVYWSADADGWTAQASDVEDACRAAGLDPVVTLPGERDWRVAFGRAVEAERAARGADFRLEKIGPGPNDETRLAVCRAYRNGSFQVDPNQGIVTCPTDGTAPSIEKSDAWGIASSIIQRARGMHGVFRSGDIRAAVTDTLDRWQVRATRKDGVVYYATPASLPTVRQLQAFVEGLGWGRIEILESYASDLGHVRAAVNGANSSLEGRLSAFAKEADAYAAKAGSTRPSTIEEMISEAKRIRQEADLYRTILGTAVSKVDDRVAAVEASLRATLGLAETAAATRKEETKAGKGTKRKTAFLESGLREAGEEMTDLPLSEVSS